MEQLKALFQGKNSNKLFFQFGTAKAIYAAIGVLFGHNSPTHCARKSMKT